jgi:hypothetical protein
MGAQAGKMMPNKEMEWDSDSGWKGRAHLPLFDPTLALPLIRLPAPSPRIVTGRRELAAF